MNAVRIFPSAGSTGRRTVLRGITAALLAEALSSRPGRAAPAQAPIRIGGTGMALAAVSMIGKAFTAAEPETTIEVLPSLSTAGGLAAVAAGAVDLALSARPITDAERDKGLQGRAYARTPIALVTAANTGVDGIRRSEMALIFSGAMTDWPNGAPIRLVRREPSDADWALLRGLSPEMGKAVTAAFARPGLVTVATDQENGDTLEALRGSFGAMSLSQLVAEGRRLTPLRLDGVLPGVEALESGAWPLSRTLTVAWSPRVRPPVERFLAFLADQQAAAILTGLACIPLPAAPP